MQIIRRKYKTYKNNREKRKTYILGLRECFSVLTYTSPHSSSSKVDSASSVLRGPEILSAFPPHSQVMSLLRIKGLKPQALEIYRAGFDSPDCLLQVALLSAIVTLHSFVDLLSLSHFWKAHLPKCQSPGSNGLCQGLIAPDLMHQYDYDCPKKGPNCFNENLPEVVVLVTRSIDQSLLAAKPWETGAHCYQRELTSKGNWRGEKQN